MNIYGPVPSWRLGNSLGVDLVKPPSGYSKICSFNCVYCQLGDKCFKTDKPVKVDSTEKDFMNLKVKIDQTKPDILTFSGQGEPTINLNLGAVAARIKRMTKIPLAVLTNASLANDPAVKRGLERCDLVIAKIDAPNQELFDEINRPSRGMLLSDIVRSIKELKTRVAIQTLLFSSNGLTNADEKTIREMIHLYQEIHSAKPITIFLGTAYRPSGKAGLRRIGEKRLGRIASQINQATGIEVVYYMQSQPKAINRNLGETELVHEVLDLLRRRPCTEKEIFTRYSNPKVRLILKSLLKRGLIEKRSNFYIAS